MVCWIDGLYVELFDTWFVFGLDLVKSLDLCFEWLGTILNSKKSFGIKNTKRKGVQLVNCTGSIFSQIVVFDTPSSVVTRSSGTMPLTWCCRVPPYFFGLRNLGKMKILTSLTVGSSWNLVVDLRHVIFVAIKKNLFIYLL